jgi:hypothetical protein
MSLGMMAPLSRANAMHCALNLEPASKRPAPSKSFLAISRITGIGRKFECTQPKILRRFVTGRRRARVVDRECRVRKLLPDREIVGSNYQPAKSEHVSARLSHHSDLGPSDLLDGQSKHLSLISCRVLAGRKEERPHRCLSRCGGAQRRLHNQDQSSLKPPEGQTPLYMSRSRKPGTEGSGPGYSTETVGRRILVSKGWRFRCR